MVFAFKYKLPMPPQSIWSRKIWNGWNWSLVTLATFPAPCHPQPTGPSSKSSQKFIHTGRWQTKWSKRECFQSIFTLTGIQEVFFQWGISADAQRLGRHWDGQLSTSWVLAWCSLCSPEIQPAAQLQVFIAESQHFQTSFEVCTQLLYPIPLVTLML